MQSDLDNGIYKEFNKYCTNICLLTISVNLSWSFIEKNWCYQYSGNKELP